MGDPQEFAQRYYAQGIDEIVYIDAVASLYGRNNLSEIVSYTASETFIPITVGGGIRSVDDARTLLLAGADKIAVNTEATKNPNLISKIAEQFGSQCIVLSIQAKRRTTGGWEAYRDLGREHTGLDVVEWAQEAQRLGAGEILLTSVDQEGTQKAFDVDLTLAVSEAVTIPVIASGGMGQLEHLGQIVQKGKADAVAIAHVLHYGKYSVGDIRNYALEAGLSVRKTETPANDE
jgi:cyclase